MYACTSFRNVVSYTPIDLVHQRSALKLELPSRGRNKALALAATLADLKIGGEKGTKGMGGWWIIEVGRKMAQRNVDGSTCSCEKALNM